MTAPDEPTGQTPEHDPEGEIGSSEVGPGIVAATARGGRHAKPIRSLDDIDVEDRSQDLEFKRIYGYTLLWMVGGQLVLANLAFFIYAGVASWRVEGYVMATWLSSTVVQVIGLTWIVVRSLFPPEPPRTRQQT